mgnify:CR=1 FL=1
MDTYIVQKQSPQAQQYNVQLDGNTYTASIYWMAFSQRFYIVIYDSAGDIIVNKALISSDYDVNLLAGYFASIMYYNESDSVLQVI